MVKIRKIIECDCKEGTLEEIARTKESNNRPNFTERYMGNKRTVYYACDNCDAIFEKDLNSILGGIEGKEDITFHKYKGSLTKHQIKQYALSCYGSINQFDENRILEEIEKAKKAFDPQI